MKTCEKNIEQTEMKIKLKRKREVEFLHSTNANLPRQ